MTGPWIVERCPERQADTETTDENPSAVAGGVERGPDEQLLRASVAGVHEEHAVADDLEVIPAASQDQLTARRVPPIDHDRVGHLPRFPQRQARGALSVLGDAEADHTRRQLAVGGPELGGVSPAAARRAAEYQSVRSSSSNAATASAIRR